MSKEEKITLLLGKFRKEVNEVFVGITPKPEGIMDEMYDCDIYIFRHPGMGNSKQIISGNKVSILTATTSYLKTLMVQGILNEKELKNIVKMATESIKEE